MDSYRFFELAFIINIFNYKINAVAIKKFLSHHKEPIRKDILIERFGMVYRTILNNIYNNDDDIVPMRDLVALKSVVIAMSKYSKYTNAMRIIKESLIEYKIYRFNVRWLKRAIRCLAPFHRGILQAIILLDEDFEIDKNLIIFKPNKEYETKWDITEYIKTILTEKEMSLNEIYNSILVNKHVDYSTQTLCSIILKDKDISYYRGKYFVENVEEEMV